MGILIIAAIPAGMNLAGQAEGAGFIQLILAGVLGWATAYVIIHVSALMLRRLEPNANRPYRAPLVPIPQILGIGLSGSPPTRSPRPGSSPAPSTGAGSSSCSSPRRSRSSTTSTYKSLGAIMRPVPLAEVHREAELIEEELPLPVEPGGPHLPHHDDEK